MFLVDFEKLGNIQSLEIDKEEKRSVFDILDSLSYKSENDQIKERSLPAYTIDLSNEIDKLLQEKLIVECLGKKKGIYPVIYTFLQSIKVQKFIITHILRQCR